MESPLLFSLNFASLIYQLINAYDLLLIVRTASLANSVRHHQCTTFAALYQCRSAHFPVCSSLIASCFGRLLPYEDPVRKYRNHIPSDSCSDHIQGRYPCSLPYTGSLPANSPEFHRTQKPLHPAAIHP